MTRRGGTTHGDTTCCPTLLGDTTLKGGTTRARGDDTEGGDDARGYHMLSHPPGRHHTEGGDDTGEGDDTGDTTYCPTLCGVPVCRPPLCVVPLARVVPSFSVVSPRRVGQHVVSPVSSPLARVIPPCPCPNPLTISLFQVKLMAGQTGKNWAE